MTHEIKVKDRSLGHYMAEMICSGQAVTAEREGRPWRSRGEGSYYVAASKTLTIITPEPA